MNEAPQGIGQIAKALGFLTSSIIPRKFITISGFSSYQVAQEQTRAFGTSPRACFWRLRPCGVVGIRATHSNRRIFGTFLENLRVSEPYGEFAHWENLHMHRTTKRVFCRRNQRIPQSFGAIRKNFRSILENLRVSEPFRRICTTTKRVFRVAIKAEFAHASKNFRSILENLIRLP